MRIQNLLVLTAMVNGINAYQFRIASCKNADNSLNEENTRKACADAKSSCSDCTFVLKADGSGNGGPPAPRCRSEFLELNDVVWGDLCKAYGSGAVGG
ncbi:hypothetical protein HYFRA_00014126 [Hymenoscyphus fraxineus]|uniref:Uncharacterized protein n=1 Tax=Hymenoscyphus fraxineus TaxID=746836 RepID=A0A9N9Q0C8_9HELO|nr:hypothetical protein HYFRA_00014126 [Hymenoscyphus fraxineus]